jgi:phosphate transport system substrate-binding protein
MSKLSINAVIVSLIVLFSLVVSCNPQKNEKLDYDTPTSGTIHISVDESFRPVMEEQIEMYEASYPGTRIIAHYKPEAECIRDLFKDTSNRMVIITRGLTDKEERFFIDSLKYTPAWNAVATDAVAVIVHKESTDTLFTLARLKSQLMGKTNREQVMVFDGLNATSTVRFITDSVLKGEKFDTSVVKAAKTSKEVIEYISAHKNAIGLIGINWIGNPENPEQVEQLSKVKIGYVECVICQDTPYVKPMQESILSKRYPLVRGLYYINKENYVGLGTGFINFLKYERGQLIFRRAYLGPVMSFGIRNVKLNEKLPNK